MRTGRPKKPLMLTEEQEEKLTQWARRPKTAQRTALRANIVLKSARGVSNQAVAKHLRVAAATVGKWRRRFVEKGLDGLTDEPRPGAPRGISDAKVEEVVTRTLESTPSNATHGSTRSMAREMKLSRATIHRICRRSASSRIGRRTSSFRRTRIWWRRSATSWACT